jgi:hypothetical protein
VGVVLPALNETLVKFSDASALLSDKVTVTLEGGAAARVTGNVTFAPGPTVRVPGIMIPTEGVTVMVSVADVRFAALAVITDEPVATPFTGIATEVEPAAMVAVLDKRDATPLLLDVIVKFNPPTGAGPDRVNVRF